LDAGDVRVKLGLDSTQYTAGLRKARDELGRFVAGTGKLSTAMPGPDTRGLLSGFSTVQRAGQALGQNLSRSFTQANHAATRLSQTTGGLGRLLATVSVAYAAKQLIGGAIQTASAFENLNTRLISLRGNLAQVEADTRWITQFAANTPLQLEEVSKAFVRLTAAGLDATKILPGLTEGVAAFGGTGEMLDRVIQQFTQMIAKNRVLSEDLSIIAETGIPVFDLLREKLKLSDEQMSDLSKSGVTALQAISAIAEGMGERFAGSSQAMSRTWTGILSNIQDTWTLMQKAIMDAGLFDWLKANADLFREQMVGALKNTEDQGQHWAQATIAGVETITLTVAGLIDTFHDLQKTLDGLAKVPVYSQISGGIDELLNQATAVGKVLRGELSFKQLAGSNAEELKTLLGQTAALPAPEGSARAYAEEWLKAARERMATFAPAREAQAARSRPTPLAVSRPAFSPEGTGKSDATRVEDLEQDLARRRLAITALAQALGNTFDPAKELAQALEHAITGLIEHGVDPASTRIKTLTGELAQLNTQLAVTKTATESRKVIEELGEGFQRLQEKMALASSIARTPAEAAQTTIEQLQGQMREIEQALDKLANLQRSTQDPAQVTALGVSIDELKHRYAGINTELQRRRDLEAAQHTLTDMAQATQGLRDQLSVLGLNRREREAELLALQKIRELEAQGPVSDETRQGIRAQAFTQTDLAQQLEDAQSPLDDFVEAGQTAWQVLESGLLDSLGSMEDALVEFFLTGKGGFEGFLKSIETTLMRTLTHELITRPLAEGIQGLLKSTGGGAAAGAKTGTTPWDWIKSLVGGPPLPTALQEAAQGGTGASGGGGLAASLSTTTPAVGTFGQALLSSIPSIEAFTASLQAPSLPAAATATPLTAGPARLTADLGRYTPEITAAAAQTGLDPRLIAAVMQQESAGRAGAVSPKGAQGLMQLMPATARGLGVTNPLDPAQNLLGGATYLKQQLDQFGSLSQALAAYNAGPGNVTKYGGIPPFKDTQAYVPAVAHRFAALGGDPAQPFAGALAQATPPIDAFSQALTQTTPALEGFRSALATPAATPLATDEAATTAALQGFTPALSGATLELSSFRLALQQAALSLPTGGLVPTTAPTVTAAATSVTAKVGDLFGVDLRADETTTANTLPEAAKLLKDAAKDMTDAAKGLGKAAGGLMTSAKGLWKAAEALYEVAKLLKDALQGQGVGGGGGGGVIVGPLADSPEDESRRQAMQAVVHAVAGGATGGVGTTRPELSAAPPAGPLTPAAWPVGPAPDRPLTREALQVPSVARGSGHNPRFEQAVLQYGEAELQASLKRQQDAWAQMSPVEIQASERAERSFVERQNAFAKTLKGPSLWEELKQYVTNVPHDKGTYGAQPAPPMDRPEVRAREATALERLDTAAKATGQTLTEYLRAQRGEPNVPATRTPQSPDYAAMSRGLRLFTPEGREAATGPGGTGGVGRLSFRPEEYSPTGEYIPAQTRASGGSVTAATAGILGGQTALMPPLTLPAGTGTGSGAALDAIKGELSGTGAALKGAATAVLGGGTDTKAAASDVKQSAAEVSGAAGDLKGSAGDLKGSAGDVKQGGQALQQAATAAPQMLTPSAPTPTLDVMPGYAAQPWGPGTALSPSTTEEIPTLGQGGIVTHPTLAWIGERGVPEAVIPLQAGGMVGLTQGLSGIGGAAGAMGLNMLTTYALNALFGDPAERQENFDKAMKAYQAAFGERVDARTGHLIIGSSRVDNLPGVDATTRVDWASRVPGAVGYLETPELERASIMEQMLRMLGSLGATMLGSRLGSGAVGLAGGLIGKLGSGPATSVNAYGTRSYADSATTGMYPGYQAAALGGTFKQATMALIGEGGRAEAVVPMTAGAIPARRLGGGLVASLPGGRSIPIRIAALATGGVINPMPTSQAFSSQATAGSQGMSGREGPMVVVNVTSPDVASFKASHNQIASQMALALRLAQSRS
jgi:tape measure domain-containing protein